MQVKLGVIVRERTLAAVRRGEDGRVGAPGPARARGVGNVADCVFHAVEVGVSILAHS